MNELLALAGLLLGWFLLQRAMAGIFGVRA
jgi:hypothetical protein